MQPQDAQMMGQVAPAGAMGQQVIIVQNKSGGPKVFGIIAIILGLLGVLGGFMTFTEQKLKDLGGGCKGNGICYRCNECCLFWTIPLRWCSINGISKERCLVWIRRSRCCSIEHSVINVLVVAAETEKVFGEDAGGYVAGFGMVYAGIQAVCCSLIIALPLLMNGADLD